MIYERSCSTTGAALWARDWKLISMNNNFWNVEMLVQNVIVKNEKDFLVNNSYELVKNLANTKSIYEDKNNNKFKNKLVKAIRDMLLQYYIDIHKIS